MSPVRFPLEIHDVAAYHDNDDMTACLCVSLFIRLGVLDEHAYVGEEHADS